MGTPILSIYLLPKRNVGTGPKAIIKAYPLAEPEGKLFTVFKESKILNFKEDNIKKKKKKAIAQ